MKVIKQKYIINAPIEKVWKALVDPRDIDSWGGGPSKMNDKEGFKFEFWGGDIFGKNIEVVPTKKLVQEWQYRGWKNPSIVTFNLSSKGDKTEAELIHEDVPDSEASDINQGWKDYYLGPLKDYVEK